MKFLSEIGHSTKWGVKLPWSQVLDESRWPSAKQHAPASTKVDTFKTAIHRSKEKIQTKNKPNACIATMI